MLPTIQIDPTPNPRAKRFLPGTPLHDGPPFDAPDAESAQASPLAARLFAIEGVEGVMIGADWISVALRDADAWDATGPTLALAIATHLSEGHPILAAGPAATRAWEAHTPEEADLLERIDAIIATRVRPALAGDGGDAILLGLVDGQGVRLRLQGACVGCPSSTITLKMGIENLLRHHFPGEVGWVEAGA